MSEDAPTSRAQVPADPWFLLLLAAIAFVVVSIVLRYGLEVAG